MWLLVIGFFPPGSPPIISQEMYSFIEDVCFSKAPVVDSMYFLTIISWDSACLNDKHLFLTLKLPLGCLVHSMEIRKNDWSPRYNLI